MLASAEEASVNEILRSKQGIQAAARWILREGYLPQFSLAQKISTRMESPLKWQPFETLEDLET